MYERMLDKSNVPTLQDIHHFIGESAGFILKCIETALKQRYDLSRDLRFPFGNEYGWGYKYSHKTKHLCYLFFEKGAITVMLQLGGGLVARVEAALPDCLPKTQAYWAHRYPCGEGGWIHYRILCHEELHDVLRLLAIKQKPALPPQL